MIHRRLVLLLACVAHRPLAAQTSQRVSLQGSALLASLFGSAYQGLQAGVGGEIQARFTPGALSFGAGFQITGHQLAGFTNTLQLLGAFVEPRYVLPARPREWAAPYVSARLSILQQRLENAGQTNTANGLTANIGGGFMFRLSDRTNGEAGATYGYTRFGKLSSGASAGSGSNIVVRVGLAMGVLR